MSGVHYYGDTGQTAPSTRADAPGDGLPQPRWPGLGGRRRRRPPTPGYGVVVLLRTGLPLHPAGGLLKPLMLPFKLGVGGPLGNGRQYVPWISLPDWLAAVEFLLTRDDVAGPVNLTGPEPVRNKEFAKALGRHAAPAGAVPGAAARADVVAGRRVRHRVLMSQRVLPAVLTDTASGSPTAPSSRLLAAAARAAESAAAPAGSATRPPGRGRRRAPAPAASAPRSVSSSTPNATANASSARNTSGSTPSAANVAASTTPAEVITPPVTARPGSVPARWPRRPASSRTRVIRKML